MKMENIEIYSAENRATGGAYIQVKADTERFGKGEVMYEGNTFDDVFAYIKRELGIESVQLHSAFIYELVTDRKGRCFPCYMKVA